MKLETIFAYVVAVIVCCCCCCCCCYATAFLTNSPAARKKGQQLNNGLTAGLTGLTGYAAATDSTYPPSGSINFGPRDSPNGNERSVYDPGDELLRALNAEMDAELDTELVVLPEELDYADPPFNDMDVASKYDVLRKLEEDLREEREIVSKSEILMKFLEDPTTDTLPLMYVEQQPILEEPDYVVYPATGGLEKRSRYYRRYPWKRHNRNRSNYEPELRHACTPSKEDVFKLLVGLHENRNGNHHKTVQFCNRKRPAKVIFTNIRFLG